MSELRTIPNVGKATERDLIAMGYTTIASLKGKTADELYAEECALRGFTLDRCQLYLYRAVEYYVNSEAPDPARCKWWLWKDEVLRPSPAGRYARTVRASPPPARAAVRYAERCTGCNTRAPRAAPCTIAA